ncbi:MAG: FG-GAP repeat domain-containing protein [Phycisphaerales bacterium]
MSTRQPTDRPASRPETGIASLPAGLTSPPSRRRRLAAAAALGTTGLATTAALGLAAGLTPAAPAAPAIPSAQSASAEDDLGRYFGFTGLEVMRIGQGAGPMMTADINGDGRMDILVANDRESRIEVHLQRVDADPSDARPSTRTNEFPEHWRFERMDVPVRHAIGAMVVRDFDGDGRADIAYSGRPSEVVFLRQLSGGGFDVERRHRRPELSMAPSGLMVADVIDDEAPEMLMIVGGAIHVTPLDGTDLGQELVLSAGAPILGMRIADFNGDGRQDVAALLRDGDSPLRLWAGGQENGRSVLGAQQRFEMPELLDARPVRVPGRTGTLMATIEAQARRLVLSELVSESIDGGGDRDAAFVVRSYTNPEGKQRAYTVVDLDGDGRTDLVTSDVEANALSVHRQVAGKGLQAGVRHPTLSDLKDVVSGNVDDDPAAELFVLSEDEKLVGRCDVTVENGRIVVPFPRPLSLPSEITPIAIQLVDFKDAPRLAVIGEAKREYTVLLLGMDGTSESVELGKLSRAPEALVPVDADQDGRLDLIVLTNNRPPAMITRDADGAFIVLESDDMGQAGLVQAAGTVNTDTLDVDGDGIAELLIADGNYVRAVRYQVDPGPGISPGWQVVRQVNARDSGAKLQTLAVQNGRIVAGDTQTDSLVVMSDGEAGWAQTESLAVRGFNLGPVVTGSFSGDAEPNVLSLGADGFAIVQFGGERLALREVASWRPEDERQRPHEIGVGDLNADGFVDLVSLDAGEQMCDILSIDSAGGLQHAVGFKVFESRMFSGGSTREYEPSQALIADVTGDGAADLILLAHDRILVYPQMTAADADAG